MPSISIENINAPGIFSRTVTSRFSAKRSPYLLELVRYIHLNPLRAGLVPDLETLDRYRWSGHAVLLGHRSLEGQERTKCWPGLEKAGHVPGAATNSLLPTAWLRGGETI